MTEVRDQLAPYYFHQRDFSSLAELEDWFEWEIPETFNIATYVCDRWAAEAANRPAIVVDGEGGRAERYSFAEVRKMANQMANALEAAGIGPGDRVAINGTQGVESLVANVATFKIGAVSVPLTVLLGTDGLRYRMQDCGAVAFFIDEAAMDAFEDIRHDLEDLGLCISYDKTDRDGYVRFTDAIDGRSEAYTTYESQPDENAFIIYTSGTTGDPKGVVHAHRHLLGELPQFLSLMCHRTDSEQVVRTVAEWSWIMSLPGMVLPALFYGIPVVAAPGGPFDPEREFSMIERFDITQLNLPPTAVRMMMQIDQPEEQYDLASIQSFTTGGESADAGIIEWVHETFENASFLEGYGTSEIGGLISDDPAMGIDHRIGYFGVPSVGHEVAVLDRETHEPIEESHEIGILAVAYEGDPMLFKEYLNLPEKTDAVIQDGWLISDDLVSTDEDGYVKFHSRADDLIISSGYRIAPTEIEEALLAHDAIQHAGVIGIPHETRGEIPKAFIELAPAEQPSDALAEELQDFVKDRLAKYEYPRKIEFTEELPTTTTGKVRRKSLREREDIA